jgi:hypothetical protein
MNCCRIRSLLLTPHKTMVFPTQWHRGHWCRRIRSTDPCLSRPAVRAPSKHHGRCCRGLVSSNSSNWRSRNAKTATMTSFFGTTKQQSTVGDNQGSRIGEKTTTSLGCETPEEGHGRGNLVEFFELHEIDSRPTFRLPRSRRRTGTYSACVLGVGLRYWRHDSSWWGPDRMTSWVSASQSFHFFFHN